MDSFLDVLISGVHCNSVIYSNLLYGWQYILIYFHILHISSLNQFDVFVVVPRALVPSRDGVRGGGAQGKDGGNGRGGEEGENTGQSITTVITKAVQKMQKNWVNYAKKYAEKITKNANKICIKINLKTAIFCHFW